MSRMPGFGTGRFIVVSGGNGGFYGFEAPLGSTV
jgi:hypothetical protein